MPTSPPIRAPRPAPYSGTATDLTPSERTRAAHAMKTLGGFASAIAEAYFVADSGNEARLIRAFPELFLKAHELNRLDAWRHSNRV